MLRGIKSLLLGVVAGTALGVLFAPKKGNETRKGFKSEIEKGGTGLDTLRETATEIGKDFKALAEDAYEEVSKNPKVKKAKSKVKSEVKKGVKKAKSGIKKKVKEVSSKKKQ